MLNHLFNQFVCVGAHVNAAKKHLKSGYCGSALKRLDTAMEIIEKETNELRRRLEQNVSERDSWGDL